MFLSKMLDESTAEILHYGYNVLLEKALANFMQHEVQSYS